MAVKTVKFGGSSLASAAQFKKVAAIIKADPERRYVVASAPGKRDAQDVKVTDMLYACFQAARKKQDIEPIFAKIEQRYNEIISELGLDFSLKEEFEKIKFAISHHVGEDYTASRGEYLNSMVLAEYLGYDFIDAENGIFFKENGTFDADHTNDVLAEILSEHERAVIPGFYGSMPNGTIKTFSRGGSDITGSIVARAVDAEVYENWTDVSGMLMADPRIVKNPKVIKVITYSELRELSYMGATVLHDEAIFPVREARIPINIRNTNAPEEEGTMIVPFADKPNEDIITGVAGKVGFSIINIEKSMMNSEVGFGKKILKVIENHDICFEHLPSGIDTMSVVVDTAEIEGIREDVVNEMFRKTKADFINVEDGLALIAVVGRSMVQQVGTAGRVFTAMGKAGVNIKMIDQGSSELSIIIGINEADYAKTLNAIYSEFVKD
ncbi:MAG: aspartate kinase [Ruminococcaceae bacterium]|nr:aspartate kinase [Oscillospiraceae bacterium]